MDFDDSSAAVGEAKPQSGAALLPDRRRDDLRGFLARQRETVPYISRRCHRSPS